MVALDLGGAGGIKSPPVPEDFDNIALFLASEDDTVSAKLFGCAFEIVFLLSRLVEHVGQKVFRKPFSLNASRCYFDDPSAPAQGLHQQEEQKVRVQGLPLNHGPETPAILFE